MMDQGAKASANSIYGFAFHPDAVSRVYVATGKWHDYPMGWYAGPLAGERTQVKHAAVLTKRLCTM